MRGKTNIKRIIAVLIVLLMLLACAVTVYAGSGNGDGTGGGKDKPLALESCSIPNGAQNVSQNPQIVLTFNKNVVHFTVRDNNKACFSMTDETGANVPINVIMGDDQVDPSIKRIVTVTPQNALTPGTTYLLKIGGGITSKSGVSLGRDSYVSFTVAGEKPTEPPATEAPTTQPQTTEAPTTQPPATTQPSTTQAPTTQAPTTQPATTQPSTTQPPSTEPTTAQPSTAEQSTEPTATTPTETTTAEMTTEPTTAASEPSTTEPSTTEPSTTEPVQTPGAAASEENAQKKTFGPFFWILIAAITAAVLITVFLIIKKKHK